MNLDTKVKQLVSQHKMNISQALDQHFLVNERYINALIEAAGVSSSSKVLEIGPGLGFITHELLKHTHVVTAVEIDKQFDYFLSHLPIQVMYQDVHEVFKKKQFSFPLPFDVIVGNIPYKLAMTLVSDLLEYSFFESIVFIMPLSTIDKIKDDIFLGAYYKPVLLRRIPQNSFYPEPHTSSGIIRIEKREDNGASKELFVRKYIYQHRKGKLKNVLRELFIDMNIEFMKTALTKNEARTQLEKLQLSEIDLEKTGYEITHVLYAKLKKIYE